MLQRNARLLMREELNKEEFINLVVWDTTEYNGNLGNEFVVWYSKKEDPQNYYWGYYTTSLENALEHFKSRLER